MKKALFLGIDVGTTGVKALLIDGTGKVVDQATEEYPLLAPKPLWLEQNPGTGGAPRSRRYGWFPNGRN